LRYELQLESSTKQKCCKTKWKKKPAMSLRSNYFLIYINIHVDFE